MTAHLAAQGWVVCREVWSATHPSRPEGLPCRSRPPPHPRARTVVRLRGELPSSRAPHVRRKLLRAFARAPSILEVDLGEATYLAPEASALLLAAAATARRTGTRFFHQPCLAPHHACSPATGHAAPHGRTTSS
ncbi:STAS domain-containing protein [Streptomyces sp. 3213.3]|uniref:STAS domain-containing protein n=1 Tax=Streptomyces sp. 3213.3 TaxID=1855348 RepID=UPI0010426F77